MVTQPTVPKVGWDIAGTAVLLAGLPCTGQPVLMPAPTCKHTLKLNMRCRCSIHAQCVQVAGSSSYVPFTLERPRAQQPGLYCMVAGTNSYVLFTLDKLIAKVMKAFQGLMQDPLACKLFDMYKYECSRSVPFADAVYHANTHVVLHEDHCFRLQSQPDGQLNVQLLDPDRTEVPASEYCRLLLTLTAACHHLAW